MEKLNHLLNHNWEVYKLGEGIDNGTYSICKNCKLKRHSHNGWQEIFYKNNKYHSLKTTCAEIIMEDIME